MQVVAAVDAGLFPVDPNTPFYAAKPQILHWLSLIEPTLLETSERFQICFGLETSKAQTELYARTGSPDQVLATQGYLAV